jgi:hypothetical protein
LIDNNNALTLRSISTNAKTEYKSNGRYHTEFQQFVNYYGVPDYGSKYITAVLNRSNVTFSTLGTFDFSANNIKLENRNQVLIYGLYPLILLMQVLDELENAMDTCSSCSTPQCRSINSLYKAVAYYTGSSEQTSLFQADSPLQDVLTTGRSEYSLYGLADLICSNFATCGSSGTSNVNFDMFSAFSAMKIGLINNCSDARAQKEIVAKKIFIPLIQFVLVTIKSIPNRVTNELPNEEFLVGFTMAIGVLPMVHFCKSSSANTILQYYVGQGVRPSVSIARAAMEENYECLGITNADVGIRQ